MECDEINDRINVIINGKITEIERNIMELISEQPNATTDMFLPKNGKDRQNRFPCFKVVAGKRLPEANRLQKIRRMGNLLG